MARRQSNLGFLGMFGRSGDLRQLDAALRALDLHPAQVPEGAKLAIVNLMKDYYPDDPPADAYPPVAAIIAYCAVGPRVFEHANGPVLTADTEARVERALEDGDSPDARLVLLTLHAKLVSPATLERFELRAEED